MCTRGKAFSLGRSIGSSKFIQQKFLLAPLYQHRQRQYGALCARRMDCPVQNNFFSRAYAKDGSKQSNSLINGLKGTATALTNQINGIFDMWGLLGQLVHQPKDANAMELCLEEQHCAKELEKAEALQAEDDRKQKIWDDAILLYAKDDLEECCKKIAADKKKQAAARKKKQKELEKACKKMAAQKKKEAAAKKKKAAARRKALEKACKKLAAEKKKEAAAKKKKEAAKKKKRKALAKACKKMAEEDKKNKKC